MRKKLLALLLAAALALSLLAGCGGGKALSQVIVDLLDNLYSNVSVEADSDLTAALKQAAAEGGTEEEILSRMIEILNHKGGSITFTRLGSGQQGNHGVTLYFQPGTDPDAAARNALAKWAGTLGTLPDDGSYQADVAMIETENGYYIALDVEVLKAGKPDKPDKPDKDDEPDKPANGLTYDSASKSAIISGENGLASLVDTLQKVADESSTTLAEAIGETNITLTSDATLPADWPEDITFTGELNGNGNTITMTGTRTQGLFNEIGEDGKVLNVDIEVSGTINGDDSSSVGAVAGENNGTIQNCHVKGGTIQGLRGGPDGGRIGGIAGENKGTIQGCSSAVAVKDGEMAGGIAGSNSDGGSVTACYHADGEVSGTTAGGVVGFNYSSGTVTACYSTGNVTGTSGGTAGGVVGFNFGPVTACYWSGSPNAGIGDGNQSIDPAYSGGEHQNMVGSDWAAAVTAMNNAIANWNNNHQNDGKLCNYQYQDGNLPKIILGAPSPATPVTP